MTPINSPERYRVTPLDSRNGKNKMYPSVILHQLCGWLPEIVQMQDKNVTSNLKRYKYKDTVTEYPQLLTHRYCLEYHSSYIFKDIDITYHIKYAKSYWKHTLQVP